jgi:hypothetical protein
MFAGRTFGRWLSGCEAEPIVILYGSFDKFVDATYADIIAGKLSDEWYDILDCLRAWEDGGVWVLAYAR